MFWLYGVVGSIVYGALEYMIDPGDAITTRLYVVGGLLLSVYTALGTYRCAGNCKSPAMARLARISAISSLVLLPLLAYLELTDTAGLGIGGLL